MTPDAVLALARVALLDPPSMGPDEARAIADALAPLVARLAALPAGSAEDPPASPGRPALRADDPGPTLPLERALAGVPVVAGGLVRVPRFREDR
jgi:Asp-tRNA(Asn)/Glu-tRNA(Gln) amidotransferase C subunit